MAQKAKEYYYAHREVRLRHAKQYRDKPDVKIKHKKYMALYKRSRDTIIKTNKKYRDSHKQKIIADRLSYRMTHRDKIKDIGKAYYHNVLKHDIKHVLNARIRTGIIGSLKNHSKEGRSWCNLVGYNSETLKRSLQKTMPKGHSWQDFLNGKLHIDHIIPISVFNFTNPEHSDFKRCWALNNLQLLTASDNIKKSNHVA